MTAAGGVDPAGAPRSVPELVLRWAEQAPQRQAVVEIGGASLTYRQLWEQASRVAGGLVESGLRPGQRVAIKYPNGVAWCVAFLGTMLAGGSLFR